MMTTLKRSQAYLSQEQVDRLLDVMNDVIDVHGRGNFPTLHLTLSALMKRVLYRLNEREMKVNRVKMNGGAASYILASRDLPYTDIDLIFGGVDLSKSKNFETVKDAVLEALIDFLPPSTNKSKISPASMREAYVKKMVKVCEEDNMWSLISLNNDLGRFIELKFVDRMRRQFEFSVDSFQIHLDSILNWEDQTDQDDEDREGGVEESELSLPSVLAESVYGDFRSALRHLNKMLIDTTEPELIRGGGLLKYCQLLSRGYRPARAGQCRTLEPYMCSRFFIDFPTVQEQHKKLRNYMDNHFRGDTRSKYEYLLLLYRVVDESTVCLMNHDRRLTLCMINSMAYELNARMYYEEQRRRALAAAKVIYVQQQQSSSPSSNYSTRSTTPTNITAPSSSSSASVSSSCVTPPDRRSISLLNESDESSSIESVTIITATTAAISTVDSKLIGDKQQEPADVGRQTPSKPKPTLLYVPPNASYWIKVV